MDYKTLIELALQGQSVNVAARRLGIPQPTLHRYARGERVPDFDAGLRLVEAAGIDLAEGFKILAKRQREYKNGNKVAQDE